MGEDRIAYVVGSCCYLYDYRANNLEATLRGHSAEIVALDAQDTTTICTLSCDAVMKVWEGRTGICKQTLFVPEATFSLGYPYCLCMQQRRVILSADEGA